MSTAKNLIVSNDNMNTTQRKIKRCFDIVFSFLGIVILSPVFILLFLILLVQGNGSVIYKQERIGYAGKPFILYKFRTVKNIGVSPTPQLLPKTDGTNQTRFTKFMRDSHLDELPQLWNVLKGDMSIVGPRPERKFFIDQIMEEDPNYLFIYQMKPGLTSEATLYNGYTDSMPKMLKRLRMDIHYLRHRTISLDIQIVINTILAMFSGKSF